MSELTLSPKAEVTFKCLDCACTFKIAPVRIEDEPTRNHPFRYFAPCPERKEEVQQVNWKVCVFGSVLASTGRKTTEGKAKSAANLLANGDIDRKLSRFNAFKLGANAKTAIYFPARPGKYPQCEVGRWRATPARSGVYLTNTNLLAVKLHTSANECTNYRDSPIIELSMQCRG